MIIDAHNHPDWHGHDLHRFLANMDRFNIDQTWLLSLEGPLDEHSPSFYRVSPDPDPERGPMPLDRCRQYVTQAPQRFVLGYAPDPRRIGAIDRLAAAVDVYGVQVCGELKVRMMLDNPDALRLFRFCGEKKLPVVLHIDYDIPGKQNYPRPSWWYGGGMDPLERALEACPDTVFLGHGPGFWAHISADGRWETETYPKGPVVEGGRISTLLERYPHLYCDLSAGSGYNALNRDHVFAVEFLHRFQDRLLYARDKFDNVLQELLQTLEPQLEPGVLDQIYAGNALKLVRNPT